MKLLVKEIKSREGDLHFRRWRLFYTPWFAIYIHGIYRSDQDRDPHSHPWNFLSLILWGCYSEYFCGADGQYKARYRRIGSVVGHTRKSYHSLNVNLAPVYTLVFTFGRHQEWGYLVHGEHIRHDIYRSLKNVGPVKQTGGVT
jgi:hypothetical protein